MHLSSLHIFSWLDSLCLFSTERYFITCMYYTLSTHHLLKEEILVASKFWQLWQKGLDIFKIIESQTQCHDAVGIHWLFCTVVPEIRSMVIHIKPNPGRRYWRNEEDFGQVKYYPAPSGFIAVLTWDQGSVVQTKGMNSSSTLSASVYCLGVVP